MNKAQRAGGRRRHGAVGGSYRHRYGTAGVNFVPFPLSHINLGAIRRYDTDRLWDSAGKPTPVAWLGQTVRRLRQNSIK